jgi:hypothetical protein
MLSSGKLIFASIFAIVFIGAMIWSYKKDSISTKMHFKGASKTIIFILLLFLALFLFVKLRHLL